MLLFNYYPDTDLLNKLINLGRPQAQITSAFYIILYNTIQSNCVSRKYLRILMNNFISPRSDQSERDKKLKYYYHND